MKIAENFDAEEFVHPAVFRAVGWPRVRWYISDFMLDYALLLREVLNVPILINDWSRGGRLIGRGYRPPSYRPNGGGLFSQHYLSRALDVSTRQHSPREILEAIEANAERFKAIGLTTIENPDFTPTWLHGDCRPVLPELLKPGETFYFVNPK